jgi:hypothetical protein
MFTTLTLSLLPVFAQSITVLHTTTPLRWFDLPRQ